MTEHSYFKVDVHCSKSTFVIQTGPSSLEHDIRSSTIQHSMSRLLIQRSCGCSNLFTTFVIRTHDIRSADIRTVIQKDHCTGVAEWDGTTKGARGLWNGTGLRGTWDRTAIGAFRAHNQEGGRVTFGTVIRTHHGIPTYNVPPFHSQEWSISNFSCSLTRNSTSHSMKNLAFHSLLRWKVVTLPILTASLIHLSQEVGRMYFFGLGSDRVGQVGASLVQSSV